MSKEVTSNQFQLKTTPSPYEFIRAASLGVGCFQHSAASSTPFSPHTQKRGGACLMLSWCCFGHSDESSELLSLASRHDYNCHCCGQKKDPVQIQSCWICSHQALQSQCLNLPKIVMVVVIIFLHPSPTYFGSWCFVLQILQFRLQTWPQESFIIALYKLF